MSVEIAQRGHPGWVSRVGWSTLRASRCKSFFEPDEGGWVRATIEELPGVSTRALTMEEARELIRDALDEWLAALTSSERVTVGSRATHETLTISARDVAWAAERSSRPTLGTTTFHFTTCYGPAPAAVRAVRRLRRTCSVCAAMSPMQTMFPSASTASWPPI
jgi:predicted RNase H-like HicB family nuclease